MNLTQTIKNKLSGFNIQNQKFILFNNLEINSLKVGYLLEVSKKDEKSFVVIQKIDDQYRTLNQEDIQTHSLAQYLTQSHKIINSSLSTHPHKDILKTDLIKNAKYLSGFKKTDLSNNDDLASFALSNVPDKVYDELSTIETQVFEKQTLPMQFKKQTPNSTKKSNVSNNDSELVKFIERYAFGHRQLMLFGEKGTGKTYAIREYIEKHNYAMIKIDGHAGVDEYSLLGHLIRLTDGTFGWKNGALAQAFRKAAKGEKVVVFIDEILRLNAQTLNLMVTTMDSYKGFYELELDNPIKSSDGYVTTETIRAPIDNIWFVCATNIGSNYEVSEIDEALKDRFIMQEIILTPDEIKEFLSNKLREKNLKYSLTSLIHFYDKMNHLYESKMISHKINLRHMMDILEYAKKPDDIKLLCHDKKYAWVGLNYDGNSNKAEIDIVERAINEILQ